MAISSPESSPKRVFPSRRVLASLTAVAIGGGGVVVAASQESELSGRQPHVQPIPTVEHQIVNGQALPGPVGVADNFANAETPYQTYSFDVPDGNMNGLGPADIPDLLHSYRVDLNDEIWQEESAPLPLDESTLNMSPEEYSQWIEINTSGNVLDLYGIIPGLTDLLVPDAESAEDDEEVEADSVMPEAQAPKATFKVGSLNVLGAKHTAPGGKVEGWPDGKGRLLRAMKVIDNNDIGVVGLQEFHAGQRKVFMNQFSDEWGIFPPKARRENDGSHNPVIWKKDEFRLIKAGKTPLKYIDGKKDYASWVKLEHRESGEEFYLKSTHYPVRTDRYGNHAKERASNAYADLADIAKKMKDAPVIFVGDFNSTFVVRRSNDGRIPREKLPNCILTSTRRMVNGYNVAENRAHSDYAGEDNPRDVPPCPNRERIKLIDHWFVTEGITVDLWGLVHNLKQRRITDHPLVYGEVTIE